MTKVEKNPSTAKLTRQDFLYMALCSFYVKKSWEIMLILYFRES